MSVSITPGTGTSSVAAEVVGGLNYQQIEVYGQGGGSVLGIYPDGSIKASIIGVPTVSFYGSPSISGAVTIVGTPTVNITGTPSISGTVIVAGLQGASVSGTVNLGSAPSVYGNISGSVVGFQGGAWTASVVGGPVTLYAPSSSFVSAVTSVMTGTASITVLTGAPGGQRNYITHILATNAAAVGTFVNIYDGGNVVYSGYAAASGGGFSATLPVPLRQASAQGALCVATPTQASVVVAVSGYTAT